MLQHKYLIRVLILGFMLTLLVPSVFAQEPPVATDNSYTIFEDPDTPFYVMAPGILGDDTDVDGDPLSADLVTDVSNGKLKLNPDGSFTYMPNENFNGEDSFTYVANNSQANSNEATVTIIVMPVNDPPICDDASASPSNVWPPNHKLVEIAVNNVTDPDGDEISIKLGDISSDEDENGKGDGNTAPDSEGDSVRGERSGQGDGRTYTIKFTAIAGNDECSGTITVKVPHDRRLKDEPVTTGTGQPEVPGNGKNKGPQGNIPINPGNSELHSNGIGHPHTMVAPEEPAPVVVQPDNSDDHDDKDKDDKKDNDNKKDKKDKKDNDNKKDKKDKKKK